MNKRQKKKQIKKLTAPRWFDESGWYLPDGDYELFEVPSYKLVMSTTVKVVEGTCK